MNRSKIGKILIQIRPYFRFYTYLTIIIVLISTYIFAKSESEQVWTMFGYIMIVGLFAIIPLHIIGDLLNLVKEEE